MSQTFVTLRLLVITPTTAKTVLNYDFNDGMKTMI